MGKFWPSDHEWRSGSHQLDAGLLGSLALLFVFSINYQFFFEILLEGARRWSAVPMAAAANEIKAPSSVRRVVIKTKN